MTIPLLEQLLDIAKQTRIFLQGQDAFFEQPSKPLPTPLAVKPPAEKMPPAAAATVPKKMPQASLEKPIESVSRWHLEPMPAPPSTEALKQKLEPYAKITTPAHSVSLILPEENGPQRLFLENVARAITRHFLSACVVLYDPQLFSKEMVPFLLIPASFLKKKFPLVKPHFSFKEKTTTILPLEDLNLYDQDITAKKALWSAIQHLLQS